MELVDTHSHLDDEQFDGIRDQVVQRAQQARVNTIVAVGTTAASSQKCIEIATTYDALYAAVGIQPNYCAEAQPGDWDEVVRLATHRRVIAIGETGLDRYWDHTPLDMQRDYFDRHLRLSQQLGKPFIVHMRDCGADVLEMLRQAHLRGPLQGVMHSYTGDTQLASDCLQLGLHISFAGMVTYKKSDELRQVANQIPDDRLLIETDAPYLSPHPKRGQRPNEPSLLVHTARCLADSRGVSAETLAEITSSNAQRFFGLSQ